jgi:predicted AlkP superfamily phosphohydrolase/phosphomutase
MIAEGQKLQAKPATDFTKNQKRVLVIGMDAVTLDLLIPWVKEEKLPHIAKLMANGGFSKLASTMQPISAPAWTSFMTGMQQGKHGLYDFVRRKSDSYEIEVTNASMISAPTLFDLVSEAGKRVIAINVPYTYPPKPVNGVVISGPFTAVSDDRIVYPPEKAESILNLVENYRILPDYDATKPKPLSAYGEALLQAVEMRRQIALHLIKEDWDLFTVVFMATDPVQHYFWHCMSENVKHDDCPHDMILRVYQRVDSAIGDLLAEIDEYTVVMLLSDHGAGPLDTMVNLNRWLADHDWLQFYSATGRQKKRWRRLLVDKAMRLYKNNFSSELRARIRRWLGARRFDQIKGGVESTLFSSVIDWQKTQAYALGAGGNIYLNVRGREPEGVIEPGQQYEEILEKLSSDLYTLIDPDTGANLLKKVWRREDLYKGPNQHLGPDLILEWSDYKYWGRGRYDVQNVPVFEKRYQMEFSDLVLTGAHRRYGVLILYGPGVKTGFDMSKACIVDLAPTILAFLNLPIPDDMDGLVLQDAFDEDAIKITYTERTQHKGKAQEFTDSESEHISDRLRQLGYL